MVNDQNTEILMCSGSVYSVLCCVLQLFLLSADDIPSLVVCYMQRKCTGKIYKNKLFSPETKRFSMHVVKMSLNVSVTRDRNTNYDDRDNGGGPGEGVVM